jgi:hypothetical protein
MIILAPGVPIPSAIQTDFDPVIVMIVAIPGHHVIADANSHIEISGIPGRP